MTACPLPRAAPSGEQLAPPRSFQLRTPTFTADVVLLRRSSGQFEGITEDYLAVSGDTDMAREARFVAQLELDEAGDLLAVPAAGDR